eukprot:3087561-Alexandrium_andersonii.AAC.1
MPCIAHHVPDNSNCGTGHNHPRHCLIGLIREPGDAHGYEFSGRRRRGGGRMPSLTSPKCSRL